MKYSYHIYGDTRHKIVDYPKYNDMHNMFKNKGVKLTKKQAMVKPEVSNPSVHMVNVNMAITKKKVTKESYILKQQWCLSVYVGSAWKILPVTGCSLWSFPRCN